MQLTFTQATLAFAFYWSFLFAFKFLGDRNNKISILLLRLTHQGAGNHHSGRRFSTQGLRCIETRTENLVAVFAMGKKTVQMCLYHSTYLKSQAVFLGGSLSVVRAVRPQCHSPCIGVVLLQGRFRELKALRYKKKCNNTTKNGI